MKFFFGNKALAILWIAVTVLAVFLANRYLQGALNGFIDFLAGPDLKAERFSLLLRFEEIINQVSEFIFVRVQFNPQRTVVKIPGLDVTINNWLILLFLLVPILLLAYKAYSRALKTEGWWDDVLAIFMIWGTLSLIFDLGVRWFPPAANAKWLKDLGLLVIEGVALLRGRRGVLENPKLFLLALRVIVIMSFLLWTNITANVFVFLGRSIEALGKELVQHPAVAWPLWGAFGAFAGWAALEDELKTARNP